MRDLPVLAGLRHSAVASPTSPSYSRSATAYSLSYDLAELVGDPTLRWGSGWDRSGRNRIDHVRAGDAEFVRHVLADEPEEAATIAADAEHAARSRRGGPRWSSDALVGVSISASTRVDAPFADDDVLGVVARRRASAGRPHPGPRSCGRVSKVLNGDEFDGAAASRVRRRHASPRIRRKSAIDLLADRYRPPRGSCVRAPSPNGVHVPELDVRIGPKTIECHIVDFGPGGVLGPQREIVYRELGFCAPRPRRRSSSMVKPCAALLRDCARDDRLASSPVAPTGARRSAGAGRLA